MTRSTATRHYRQIFDSRSPAQLRVLAHTKRFLERLTGDPDFRAALGAAADNPHGLVRRHGIEVDPLSMLPLWHNGYRHHRHQPQAAQWPLAVQWDAYMAEMLRHRDLMREEGDMAGVHPRFQAWRQRQMQRCASELGGSAPAITHPIIAFELSDGCTVGCWFCGLSADRFRGHFAYSDDHARLWRGMVGAVDALFGPAARTGFCYWATDPCDNPEYDRFLFDYYDITGALPQTTTAAPLRDLALTRRILALFDRYRCVTNRFSVLTVRQLNDIHATFTAEQLMGVELIMHQKGALTAKADAGRARVRNDKRRATEGASAVAPPTIDHTTIACVSGFLVNLMRGSIRLVTPVVASRRWPLGYRVLGERFFATVDEFRAGLESLIDAHMSNALAPDQPLGFRRDLVFEAGDGDFYLTSRGVRHRIRDDVDAMSVGALIARGDRTASQVVAAAAGQNMLAVADLLDQLFEAGLLEDDLDDTFADAQNDGAITRAATVVRVPDRMDACHAAPR